MKELISKENLIHDLYTLNLSLQDMEKVEEYILNYEPTKSYLISEEEREKCDVDDIRWLEQEIYRLEDNIEWFQEDFKRLTEYANQDNE